jgi:DNA invertase Pin-like site-specific DNA recombinase
VSGAKTERPELMRLFDNARKGDVVIVWKLDRLARSLRQLIDTTVLLNERRLLLRRKRPHNGESAGRARA